MMRLGPLTRHHRGRVSEMLTATGVFRDEEIHIALVMAGGRYVP